jgi:hypothetical protein
MAMAASMRLGWVMWAKEFTARAAATKGRGRRDDRPAIADPA